VDQVRDYLNEVGKLHPEGIIVLGMSRPSLSVLFLILDVILFPGYSQGGLLARAAIQSLPDHNVKTFISLSSPQAGQYGSKFNPENPIIINL